MAPRRRSGRRRNAGGLMSAARKTAKRTTRPTAPLPTPRPSRWSRAPAAAPGASEKSSPWRSPPSEVVSPRFRPPPPSPSPPRDRRVFSAALRPSAGLPADCCRDHADDGQPLGMRTPGVFCFDLTPYGFVLGSSAAKDCGRRCKGPEDRFASGPLYGSVQRSVGTSFGRPDRRGCLEIPSIHPRVQCRR
jgi:hypothetical protein